MAKFKPKVKKAPQTREEAEAAIPGELKGAYPKETKRIFGYLYVGRKPTMEQCAKAYGMLADEAWVLLQGQGLKLIEGVRKCIDGYERCCLQISTQELAEQQREVIRRLNEVEEHVSQTTS